MSRGRIGYFGGTFDPPHLGHIILASEAKHQLNLDLIRWIITPDPPHKTQRVITPQEHRLKMLELVVGDIEWFEISDVDLRRSSPHYAADAVEILKNEDPDTELIYIIGEDSLRDLPTWHEPGRFLEFIDQLAVSPRPGIETNLKELAEKLPGLESKVVFLEGIEIEISSSLIRSRAAKQEPYSHFLSREVTDYVWENSLYQNKE